MKQNKSDDPHETAKLHVLTATSTLKEHIATVESENLIKEAIKIEQKINPFNEEVGNYTAILAKVQKEDIQKFINPKGLMNAKLEKEEKIIQYNEQQQNERY